MTCYHMIMKPILKFHSTNGFPPVYATDHAAAMDIKAAFAQVIPAHSSRVVGTGLYFDIPEGYQLLMFGRSGLAAKNSVRLGNSVGVIDEDYVDELKVILFNDSDKDFVVNRGDRVAQIELVPVVRPELNEIKEMPSKKGNRTGGLGSTGVQ